MSTLFDAIDAGALDLAVLVVAMLVVVVVVLVTLWRQAEAEAGEQRKRAEENYCWSILHEEEVAAVRARLAEVDRRNRTLQQMYAQATRQLLAKNYYVIEQHVRRKREAK